MSEKKIKYRNIVEINSGKEFNTIKDAAEFYNISTVAVRNTIIGKQKQAYGKTFCSKDDTGLYWSSQMTFQEAR